MRALTVFLCLLLSLSLIIPAFADGTVTNEFVWINSLGSLKLVKIYMPEGYDPNDTETRYPTVYFLHGGYTTPASYPMFIDALNATIWTGEGDPPEGYIHPVIAVLPDGNFGNYGSMTWWCNSEVNGPYSDYVCFDIVEFMDTTYNTDADVSKRAIMGHSMGGYGALSNALRHSDIFCAAGTHGGVINFTTTINGITQWVLDENGGAGPFSPGAGVWSEVMFSMAAAFSPNLDNEPDPVDLPINNDGSINTEVWPEWVNDDPPTLAQTYTTETQPALYLQVGVDDELWDVVAQACYDSLVAQGLDVLLEFHPGDHNNALEERFPYTFRFFDEIFFADAAAPEHGSMNPVPDEFRMHPVSPNPFNGTARCTLDLPSPGQLELVLFDTLGREVKTVFSGAVSPGNQTFSVNAEELASGIYFLRAELGSSHQEVQKLALLR
jgi:S-formylglutathione hydrolase FrmB